MKYKCNEILDIKYVTVASDYTRQHISTQMLMRCLKLAQILGVKVGRTMGVIFQMICVYTQNFLDIKPEITVTFLFFKAAKAEASGIYSQAAFKNLGFETLASFPYQEFKGKDAEGNNVFAKTGIHKTLDFVARSIPISNCFNLSIE